MDQQLSSQKDESHINYLGRVNDAKQRLIDLTPAEKAILVGVGRNCEAEDWCADLCALLASLSRHDAALGQLVRLACWPDVDLCLLLSDVRSGRWREFMGSLSGLEAAQKYCHAYDQ